MRGILYRIFNINNNKSYIGKTYSDIYTRLSYHVNDSKRFPKRPLYAAFNKHGLNSFSLEILGEYDEGDLEVQEQLAITKFNSYGSTGYNATLGGDGKRFLSVSEDTVVQTYLTSGNMAECSRRLKIDVDSVKKILISNKIEIVSKPKLGNVRVTIIEVGLDFDALRDCARFLLDCELTSSKDIRGIASHIKEVCSGSRKSYLGYTFKYTDEPSSNG